MRPNVATEVAALEQMTVGQLQQRYVDVFAERYRSLSAVAKAISGSHMKGFRFFGLEGQL